MFLNNYEHLLLAQLACILKTFLRRSPDVRGSTVFAKGTQWTPLTPREEFSLTLPMAQQSRYQAQVQLSEIVSMVDNLWNTVHML